MGFFKKLPHKATPAELKEVHARLDAQMNGLTQERAVTAMNEAKKEYMEWLKSATKEMIDGITTDSEFDLKLLQMSYGFVRRCFLESKKKGGAV